MTEQQKEELASRFVVVDMDAGGFKVIGVHGIEVDARKDAEEKAEAEEGRIIGVFQMIGTARLTKIVSWKGVS